MDRRIKSFLKLAVFGLLLLASCSTPVATPSTGLHVLAVESFLADIAQNVAGNRLTVGSLIPVNVDPHSFQPSPQDVAKITAADVLIINGADLEAFLAPILQNVSGKQLVITASNGLTPRNRTSSLITGEDPHFWLDPIEVIKYVDNIRLGLSQADPSGAQTYQANAEKYSAELQSLDTWIKMQVAVIAPDRRLLVTNHETFGYFADRYGFTVIGAIIPSVTSGASPSAQQLAALIDQIRFSGLQAIFLEVGTNPQLADQISSETGVKVVTDLYTHSLSVPNGPATTYIDMMKYDVSSIVGALK